MRITMLRECVQTNTPFTIDYELHDVYNNKSRRYIADPTECVIEEDIQCIRIGQLVLKFDSIIAVTIGQIHRSGA